MPDEFDKQGERISKAWTEQLTTFPSIAEQIADALRAEHAKARREMGTDCLAQIDALVDLSIDDEERLHYRVAQKRIVALIDKEGK